MDLNLLSSFFTDRCDSIIECERFIKQNYNDIKTLFQLYRIDDISKIRYKYNDLFDEMLYSNIGDAIYSTKTIPDAIVGLLLLFASFFHSAKIQSPLNDITQILTLDCHTCMKQRLTAIYEFNNIINISTDYLDKIDKIESLLIQSVCFDSEISDSAKILAEYYITGMLNLLSHGHQNKAKDFRDLLINKKSILSENDFFISCLQYNFDSMPEKLIEINRSISQDFFDAGCNLIQSNNDDLQKDSKTHIYNSNLPENIIFENKDYNNFQYHNKLPHYLEKILFDDLNAIFIPQAEEVQLCVDADADFLKIYLGTYFPRSYIEMYNICDNLFSLNLIKQTCVNKEHLYILDVGSGTGGSTVGFLEALLKWYSKTGGNVTIISVDGNKTALELQKKIISVFIDVHNYNKINFKTIHRRFSCNSSQFKSELDELLGTFDCRFDFILTSKFICEFYNRDYQNAIGSYGIFCTSTFQHLAQTGFIIMNDVTNKDNGVEWLPIIMNREINEVIRKSETISYIIPLSCAQWSTVCSNWNHCYTQRTMKVYHCKKSGDLTKISYKIISKKKYAEDIFKQVVPFTAYRINSNKPGLKCSYGNLENDHHDGILDAFNFNNSEEKQI